MHIYLRLVAETEGPLLEAVVVYAKEGSIYSIDNDEDKWIV